MLTDVADRAAAINLNDEYGARIRKILAFGGINTRHECIQDIDLGVEMEPKGGRTITDADKISRAEGAKTGRSTALKPHLLEGFWLTLPGRVVCERG